MFQMVRFYKYIIFILSRTIKSLNLREYAISKCMKQSYILLALAVMMTVTGCDFFRKIAGRPTSEYIEEKKLEILRDEEAAARARLDSLQQEQQAVRDSIAALDSLKQQGGTILNPTKLGGLFATKLESRYYIIVGTFRARSNAETLLREVADNGDYAPALISFRNGMIAVGVCPRNKIADAVAALDLVRNEAFCPSDVWILLNE